MAEREELQTARRRAFLAYVNSNPVFREILTTEVQLEAAFAIYQAGQNEGLRQAAELAGSRGMGGDKA